MIAKALIEEARQTVSNFVSFPDEPGHLETLINRLADALEEALTENEQLKAAGDVIIGSLEGRGVALAALQRIDDFLASLQDNKKDTNETPLEDLAWWVKYWEHRDPDALCGYCGGVCERFKDEVLEGLGRAAKRVLTGNWVREVEGILKEPEEQ